MSELLQSRREFLFLYDIKMGNPNGDPDENRPRKLPDGTYYVTDVRLKRFVRDYLKMTGASILVDDIEGRTTNLTGRVGAYLEKIGKKQANGSELVEILLNEFIDARLFGSSLAFKESKEFKPEPVPKTLTGAVQINHGEVLHPAQEVIIRGTSIFGSDEEKRQGTFTEYAALRYALIGFNGVANQYNARKSRMTEADYDTLLAAMWRGVRAAGNTRTKVGQNPRLLVSIRYKEGSEFQFGDLTEYLKLNGPAEASAWSGTQSYTLDLGTLRERLEGFAQHIEQVSYCLSPDLRLENGEWLSTHHNLNYDG